MVGEKHSLSLSEHATLQLRHLLAALSTTNIELPRFNIGGIDYILEAQVRATQAAMAWCEEFACSGDTRLALQGAHVEHAIEAAEAELSMDNPDSDLAAGDGAMKKQRLE